MFKEKLISGNIYKALHCYRKMRSNYQVGKRQIEVAQGNITKYSADALVCPANADLEMVAFPSGVQYAFFVDGGEEIFMEAAQIGKNFRKMPMDTAVPMSVPETSAHLTKAGKLPAKYVIHSVAVGYDLKKRTLYCNKEIIGKSTKNVLDLANEKSLKSVGFPALGTGLYNVPLEEAVETMADEFEKHLEGPTSLDRLGIILYSTEQYLVGKKVLDRMFHKK